MSTANLNGPVLHRANSTGETARLAAEKMTPKAPTLRRRVLEIIEAGPSTPEQVLAALRAAGVSTVLTSVRPRCSELVRLGLITDSGARGRAEGGCTAIIWRATTPEERALFHARNAARAEKTEGDQ